MKLLWYAALKIPALPVQPAKSVFCKFAQHQPSPPLRFGEYKEGDAHDLLLITGNGKRQLKAKETGKQRMGW